MRKVEGGFDFDAKSTLINEFMLMKCSQQIIDFEVFFFPFFERCFGTLDDSE